MPDQQPASYDLFVLHAAPAWVRGYLLPSLGLDAERVRASDDLRPGRIRSRELERLVTGSRYTLLVLTSGFLSQDWAQLGEDLATYLSVEGGRDRVIPLLKEPVEIPPRIAFRVSLDCTDGADAEHEMARLRDLLRLPEPEIEPPPCPFPGMVPFGREDHQVFFGRESDIEELLDRLRHHRRLFVIGPSGSGKSSLVHAGLLPRLDQGTAFPPGFWRIRHMRPGTAPHSTLLEVLGAQEGDLETVVESQLDAEPAARRLLLVVDQLEEAFARPSEGEESFPRQAKSFFAAIRALQRLDRCALVFTLRADFFHELMASPLWPVDASQRLEIAMLDDGGLRAAIQKPAAEVDVHVEPALIHSLITHTAGEPGALPLLQETLVILWSRMERRLLSLAAYETLGRDDRTGLQVAIANKADATVAGLQPDEQAIVRRIFLRLVQFGEGRRTCCRQATWAECRRSPSAPPDGNHLASGGADGKVRVWDLGRPNAEPIVLDAGPEVDAVAFSPDGTRLAAGGDDGILRIWTLSTETLADWICDDVRRNLSLAEWRRYVGEDIEYARTCGNLPAGLGASDRGGKR